MAGLAPRGLRTNGHRDRLMLNTFHVRCGSGRCRNARRVLQAPCGRRARRQGEKLAYANFVIDLSTPARKFNFRPRAMFDTAIRCMRTWRRRPAFRNSSPTLSNVFRIANERYLLAKERYVLVSDLHSPTYKIALTTLHRKKSKHHCRSIV